MNVATHASSRGLTARTDRAHRLVLLLAATLVACLAMLSANDGQSTRAAAPAPISSGHHAAHDIHCEPVTTPDTAATVHAANAPSVDPVSTDAPTAIALGPVYPVVSPVAGTSHPPGRSLLLAIGVDRN